MTNTMTNLEAATIVRTLLAGDHFQSFSDHDRVYDPDGVYQAEAELRTGEEAIAFYRFANMGSNERADRLDLEDELEAAPRASRTRFEVFARNGDLLGQGNTESEAWLDAAATTGYTLEDLDSNFSCSTCEQEKDEETGEWVEV